MEVRMSKEDEEKLVELELLDHEGDLGTPGHQLIECSNTVYHAGPGTGSTAIKALVANPARYKHLKDNPIQQTDPMIQGEMIHDVALEPQNFGRWYADDDLKRGRGGSRMRDLKDQLLLGNWPPAFVELKKGRKKEEHAAHAEWLAALPKGHVLVSEEEMEELKSFQTKAADIPKNARFVKQEWIDIAQAAGKAAIEDQRVRAIVDQGCLFEHSFYYRDPVTKLLLKCRPDMCTIDGKVINDIKKVAKPENTTRSMFARAIFDLHYDIQDALYSYVVGRVLEVEPKFSFTVVSWEAPHLVNVIDLPLDYRRSVQRFLAGEVLPYFKRCQDENFYPSGGAHTETVDVPRYVRRTLPPFPATGGES